MRGHPVGGKFLRGRVLADAKPRDSWKPVDVAPCRSLHDSVTVGNDDDADARGPHRKAAVVIGHNGSRLLDVRHHCSHGQSRSSPGDIDLQTRAAYVEHDLRAVSVVSRL